MARKVREKSADDFYLVKISRQNKENIFFDSEDYEKITRILKETKQKYGFFILAYSFIDVSIDILLKAENVSEIMKQFVFRCSRYLKNKYKIEENVFKKRYFCIPVTESEILEKSIVIHNISVKNHKCDENGNYKYSSFDSYFSKNDFVDTDFVFSKASRDEYFVFHYTFSEEVQKNENERIFEMKKYVCDHFGLANFREIKYIDRKMKKEAMDFLYYEKNCRVTDIGKIFNVGRQRVYAVLKNSCRKTIDKV